MPLNTRPAPQERGHGEGTDREVRPSSSPAELRELAAALRARDHRSRFEKQLSCAPCSPPTALMVFHHPSLCQRTRYGHRDVFVDVVAALAPTASRCCQTHLPSMLRHSQHLQSVLAAPGGARAREEPQLPPCAPIAVPLSTPVNPLLLARACSTFARSSFLRGLGHLRGHSRLFSTALQQRDVPQQERSASARAGWTHASACSSISPAFAV